MSKEIQELIFRMVVENPTWGAPRIYGELLMLGFAARVPRDRFSALEGEGITWDRTAVGQGIALFSVRMEFWRSTAFSYAFAPA
jgi:hypothetical protein